MPDGALFGEGSRVTGASEGGESGGDGAVSERSGRGSGED